MPRTLSILNFPKTFAQRGGVLDFEPSLIGSYGILVALCTVESSTLAIVSLGPRRIYGHALKREVGEIGGR
jgi:hypothetical protein